jgi:hypothetical protein
MHLHASELEASKLLSFWRPKRLQPAVTLALAAAFAVAPVWLEARFLTESLIAEAEAVVDGWQAALPGVSLPVLKCVPYVPKQPRYPRANVERRLRAWDLQVWALIPPRKRQSIFVSTTAL